MESWQIFNVSKKKLPPGRLQRIYRRSARLVDYWAANPRHCEKTTRNPIDRIRILLDELNLNGYGEYARWAIDYMAEPLGGHFCDDQPAKSDKGTVDGEVADITVALGDLVNTIRTAQSDGEIDTEETIKIKDGSRTLKIQIEQLLDVIGVNE